MPAGLLKLVYEGDKTIDLKGHIKKENKTDEPRYYADKMIEYRKKNKERLNKLEKFYYYITIDEKKYVFPKERLTKIKYKNAIKMDDLIFY